jgi:hypothetical protein
MPGLSISFFANLLAVAAHPDYQVDFGPCAKIDLKIEP